MNDEHINHELIANETFKLLLNTAALKSDRFGTQFEEKMKQFAPHKKKFYILFCVCNKKNCTLSDLERMLAENRSTASIAVSKLYREGLISKKKPEKEDDGRKVYFKVTKKGKEILNTFHDIFTESICSFYNNLSDENKNNFVNGIVSLNKVFEGKSDIL